MDNLINCLNDITYSNLIYTVVFVATANNIILNDSIQFSDIIMNYNITSLMDAMSPDTAMAVYSVDSKPCLLIRILKRLTLISGNLVIYLQNQFNEHTATSIASVSVLIIVLSIICCFIFSLMREEERKIKEQYKKLNADSSQSFIGISCNQQKIGYDQSLQHQKRQQLIGPNGTTFLTRHELRKLRVFELRRETYFGLVRLLKPGCRTVVLLCDAQSRLKLLSKFYQCAYPYRKNKTLQFAFLLIEKNIGWYKDLLKLALNEKRDLHINPINCIGTVLVLNGFKKYFSVYHASDFRCDPDEPFILLEESLLDNLPDWLERLFNGKASRYYVKYWPDQMR